MILLFYRIFSGLTVFFFMDIDILREGILRMLCETSMCFILHIFLFFFLFVNHFLLAICGSKLA